MYFLSTCCEGDFICQKQTAELVNQGIHQGCVLCSQDQYPIELNSSLTDSGPKWLWFVVPENTPSVSFPSNAVVPISHLLPRKPADLLLIKAWEKNRLLFLKDLVSPVMFF